MFDGGGGSGVIGGNTVLRHISSKTCRCPSWMPRQVRPPGTASWEVLAALGSSENLVCSENDTGAPNGPFKEC